MKNGRASCRILFATAVASMMLLAVFAWPMPRFFNRGIPASAQNIENPAWRSSIPGDHMQLLYHFDLMRDMLAGRIPWFQNPYEFNTGSDEERYRPGAYFFPLSALYGLLAQPLGQAAAWNLTIWFSIWMSSFFMWLWLRRFTSDKSAIALGVLASLLLPFRWISLFGGSPAGMALMWVPFLAWAIDVAVREASFISGGLVGLALLMCFWGDLQVFYFAALSMPFLVGLSVVNVHGERAIPWRRWYRVIPLAVFFLALMAVYYSWRKAHIAGSAMGDGRSWHEVRLFSPSPRALLKLGRGVDGIVFFGFASVIAMLGAAVLTFISAFRREAGYGRRLLAFVFVGLLAVGTIVLALGANGPHGGWPMRMARRVIPHYSMIRQPFKVLALMPLWLGWLLAVGWTGEWRSRTLRLGAILVLGVGVTAEVRRSISATVCLLNPVQSAYAAVAESVRLSGSGPGRILVLPIWPGESADTSLAMYYAHRYDLRLINGYSPVVSREYVENVFRRLESMNQGWIDGSQLDFLLERGIGHVLLHENQFPEKVSPFPVTLTRDRLMFHPRLELLEQDGPVWAFRILDSASASGRKPKRSAVRMPTRRWSFGKMGVEERRGSDEACHGGRYLRMEKGDQSVIAGPWRVAPDDDLKWMIRVKGRGVLLLETMLAEDVVGESRIEVDASEWTWVVVALPELPAFGQVRARATAIAGEIDGDCGLLFAGEWRVEMERGERMVLSAADFFHAGYSEWESNVVVFRPEHDPDTGVLYGPKLPLGEGVYRLEWIIDTEAPLGTRIGDIEIHDQVAGTRKQFVIRAGEPSVMQWRQSAGSIVNWVFAYHRTAPVTIRQATLTRTE